MFFYVNGCGLYYAYYAAIGPAIFQASDRLASRKKVSDDELSWWLTRMESPCWICPVAIRFDNGCTSRRSMVRFSGRAPYLESVPSLTKSSRALSATVSSKGMPAVADW